MVVREEAAQEHSRPQRFLLGRPSSCFAESERRTEGLQILERANAFISTKE